MGRSGYLAAAGTTVWPTSIKVPNAMLAGLIHSILIPDLSDGRPAIGQAL
jgi:hypothetical protein